MDGWTCNVAIETLRKKKESIFGTSEELNNISEAVLVSGIVTLIPLICCNDKK